MSGLAIPPKTKPSDKIEEVNKNSADIKQDKNTARLVPEASRMDIVNKGSSRGASSKKSVVSNSWASSYLQSIGHDHATQPIKLNLLHSRNKITQTESQSKSKTEPDSSKTKEPDTKLLLPPPSQPTSAGFRRRMDTKSWLTQASLETNSDNEKDAATIKPDSTLSREPNITSTIIKNQPITNSSALIDTPTQNKQSDSKVVSRPSAGLHNIQSQIQIDHDSNNNLATHINTYTNFTPHINTETWHAPHINTFTCPNIQDYYNNISFHSAPYAIYTPHMDVATLPTPAPTLPSHAPTLPSHAPTLPSLAPTLPSHAPTLQSHAPTLPSLAPILPTQTPTLPTHAPTILTHAPTLPTHPPFANPIYNSYEFMNNNISKQLASDHSTPYSNYHSDTFTWHTHSIYTNTLYSHEGLNTYHITPYSGYAPEIETVSHYNQVLHENNNMICSQSEDNSSLNKKTFNENTKNHSNLSDTTNCTSTSIRPCNDIVTWLTQLMSGTNANYTKSNTNNLSTHELEQTHAELSANTKFLTHSEEKINDSTYETKKKVIKQQDIKMPPSNKKTVTHTDDKKTTIDIEKRVNESPKPEFNKSSKSVTVRKNSATKESLILSSKSKKKETVCVNDRITSQEQTIAKEKLEKETAKLKARQKAVNFKIMELMSKSGSSSKPGSSINLPSGKEISKHNVPNVQKNIRDLNKDSDTSKADSKLSLPDNKDKLSLSKNLKRNNRTPERTKKKSRLDSKTKDNISSNTYKAIHRSSCEPSKNENTRQISAREDATSSGKSTKINTKNTKEKKRRKPISSENEKSPECPQKKRVCYEPSQDSESKQKTFEKRSVRDPMKEIQIKDICPVKSVVKLPNKSQSKHPRIKAPESDSTDEEHECDFDLRARLNKKNYELLSKRSSYNKQLKEKIGPPRDNIVITINGNDVNPENEEANNKLPIPSQKKPKNKKYKKIKLIIKVLCQDHEGSSESSSDDDKSSDNVVAKNIDSFLEDFNVDEIVNSLKHSPKCDKKDRATSNADQQVKLTKDTEIKKQSAKSTQSFVQPIKMKKEIKTEILDEEIQSDYLNSQETSQKLNNMTNGGNELTESSTSKEPKIGDKSETNNLKTSIIVTGEVALADLIKIKQEYDTEMLEEKTIKGVPPLNNNVDQSFKQSLGTKLNTNISRTAMHSNSDETNNNTVASIKVPEEESAVNLINIKIETDILEDGIQCEPSLNKKVDQIDKSYVGLKLDHSIKVETGLHPDNSINTNNNLEAAIHVNERADVDSMKNNIENAKGELKDHKIKYVPSISGNKDLINSSKPTIDLINQTRIEFDSLESKQDPQLELSKNDNDIKASQENEMDPLDNEHNSDNSRTSTELKPLKSSNLSEDNVSEIRSYTKNAKEEINIKAETSTKLQTDDSKADKINMENQQENKVNSNNSSTNIAGSVENTQSDSASSKSNNTVSQNGEKRMEMRQKDQMLAAELVKWVLQYLHKDVTVVSMINKGRYTTIFKTVDARGQFNAVKILVNTSSQKRTHAIGIQKTTMYKDIQKDVPKENLNTVYFINGFALGKNWCYILEYYPNNLRDVLNTEIFHLDQVQNMTRQLGSAVMMLRHNNIVHSDINPRHILLDASNQRLKLAGFDAAYYSGTRNVLPNIGTPCYRAPEIILGFSANFSIDVWAIAAVIYQIATGMKLFNGQFNNDILYLQMCTFGSVPLDMIQNSRFAHKHFSGAAFLRRTGDNGKIIKYITQMYPTRSLNKFLYTSYIKGWHTSRTFNQRSQDLAKLGVMQDLLNQMFVLDPRRRIPIEHVCAHRFIHEMYN